MSLFIIVAHLHLPFSVDSRVAPFIRCYVVRLHSRFGSLQKPSPDNLNCLPVRCPPGLFLFQTPPLHQCKVYRCQCYSLENELRACFPLLWVGPSSACRPLALGRVATNLIRHLLARLTAFASVRDIAFNWTLLILLQDTALPLPRHVVLSRAGKTGRPLPLLSSSLSARVRLV